MDKLLKTAVYVYTVFIAVICLMPMPHISNAPKDSDKIVHLLVYVVFTGLWFCYFYMLSVKKDHFNESLLKSAGLSLVYGMLIEAIQGIATTSRSADFKDLIANCIGILIGVLLIFSMKSLFVRLKTKF